MTREPRPSRQCRHPRPSAPEPPRLRTAAPQLTSLRARCVAVLSARPSSPAGAVCALPVPHEARVGLDAMTRTRCRARRSESCVPRPGRGSRRRMPFDAHVELPPCQHATFPCTAARLLEHSPPPPQSGSAAARTGQDVCETHDAGSPRRHDRVDGPPAPPCHSARRAPRQGRYRRPANALRRSRRRPGITSRAVRLPRSTPAEQVLPKNAREHVGQAPKSANTAQPPRLRPAFPASTSTALGTESPVGLGDVTEPEVGIGCGRDVRGARARVECTLIRRSPTARRPAARVVAPSSPSLSPVS